MKRTVRLCAAGFALLISLPALADTLKLVSVGGERSGGEYIYPYNFSINDASALNPLMCLNLNREVTLGEHWNVNVAATPLDSSQTSIDYRADAWIFSQLGKSSNADVQYAVWDIFDPSASSHAGFTANSQQLVNDGLMMAQNSSLIESGFFSKYDVYTSTTDQTGWTAGKPQDFIGVAQTPEPSSLLLLGTGLLGMVGAVGWRKART